MLYMSVCCHSKALSAQIVVSDVSTAYLHMWSVLPEGEHVLTRKQTQSSDLPLQYYQCPNQLVSAAADPGAHVVAAARNAAHHHFHP